MTILNSCCCFVPLRKGCLICGLYTLVTYTIMFAGGSLRVDTLGSVINDTNITNFLTHYNEAPFPVTVTVVTCSGLTVLASIVLLVGLYLENRLLLLPWILFVFITTFVDFVCTVYILGTDVFHPLFPLVVTVDCFISFANIYCLLCVISLYQQYKDSGVWGELFFEYPTQNGGGFGVHAASNSKRSVTFIENDHVSKVPLKPPPIRARRSSNPVRGAFAKLKSFKKGDQSGGGLALASVGGGGGGGGGKSNLLASNRVSLSSGNVNNQLYRENNLDLQVDLWTESKCCNGTVVPGPTALPERDRRRSSARHVQFQPTIEEAESSSDGVQVTQLKDVLGDETAATAVTTAATAAVTSLPTSKSQQPEKDADDKDKSALSDKLSVFLPPNDTSSSHLLEQGPTTTNL